MKQDKNTLGRGSSCYAYYLVTTYYYPDGTSDSTSEYLGTSCDCDSAEYMGFCNGGNGGGGTAPPPIEIINGSDDIESSVPGSQPDVSSGLDVSGFGLIPIKFSAHIRYTYEKNSHEILSVTPGNPVVLPVSQPFTDDNGDPAVLFYSITVWNFYWIPTLPGIIYVSWSFDCVHQYAFRWGNKGPFTFSEGLSKVISTW